MCLVFCCEHLYKRPTWVGNRSSVELAIVSSSTHLPISAKMNSMILICFLSITALAMARPGEDLYTDKFDNVDLDEILANRRLLVPYVKCSLEQGKCAPDAKELKDHIKEALENECRKCNETHKKGVRKVIGHLINHEAELWSELSAKYDPQNKYSHKYEKELKTLKP